MASRFHLSGLRSWRGGWIAMAVMTVCLGCATTPKPPDDGVFPRVNAQPAPYVQPVYSEWGVVLFPHNSVAISAADQARLAELAAHLNKSNRDLVHVTGYTTPSGSAAYNLDLSRRRAEAVKAALVNAGIAPARITTEGRGESALAVPGESAQNRRVVIVLIQAGHPETPSLDKARSSETRESGRGPRQGPPRH